MCHFWGGKGHTDSQCFKKNPEKAPKWWKEKNAEAESASSSVEVMLMSLGDSIKVGVDVTALQAKKGDILVILCQENI